MTRNLRNGLLFAAPWIVHLVVFIAYPIAASLYQSFCSYDALRPPRWIGVGVIVMIGIGILTGVTSTRRPDPS